jgi:C2 domain of PTEN tumour-suppressor protein
MWSSWAETAKSSVTQALEKTGDALSKAATNAGKSARAKSNKNSNNCVDDTNTANVAAADDVQNNYAPTIVQLPPKLSVQQDVVQDATSATSENQLLSNLSHGWFNVVATTRASIRHAEGMIQEQSQLLQQSITKVVSQKPYYYKRDQSLPLDVEALQDAEVVYITDRIITMGHPASKLYKGFVQMFPTLRLRGQPNSKNCFFSVICVVDSQVDGDISGQRKLAAVGHLLARRHAGRYMVWNLSEVDYDVDIFDDQVLTYSFPGSPSPPLGLLLKLFISMESWLKADSRNVAVIHCLTGKGRTSTVLAAFLCWMGEAQFSDIYQALEYIASCKQVTVEDLTIPSQRRYASYFKNMLDGIRPSQPPLMLKRIIMSEAPRFARGPPRPSSNVEDSQQAASGGESDVTQLLGCVPYIQIFKAGKLLHTAPASLHFQQGENELPFCQVADGNISFNINLIVQGDILVRARHLTPTKKRVSMFRAAFHTGYAPPNVMRFTKSQLDGACTDDRFISEFFLDFIFEPIDAEEASKLLSKDGLNDDESTQVSSSLEVVSSDSKKQRVNAVQASAEDSMLYGDSRFWDVITNRMKENAGITIASNDDPMWGPTIGRRRDVDNVPSTHTDLTQITTAGNVTALEQQKDGTVLGAFSIGGEMDFLPSVIGSESSQMQPIESPIPKLKKSTMGTATSKPAKDTLLEALMGALDDYDISNHENYDEDEIVVEFDGGTDDETSNNVLVESKSSVVVPNENEKTIVTELNETETTDASNAVAVASDSTVSASQMATSVDDVQALFAEAKMNLEDDMDALLAGAIDENTGLTDADLLNLDIDDAELDDLESFLSK